MPVTVSWQLLLDRELTLKTESRLLAVSAARRWLAVVMYNNVRIFMFRLTELCYLHKGQA